MENTEEFDDFVVAIAKKASEYLAEPYKDKTQYASLAEIPEHILREAVEACIEDIKITYAAEHRGECESEDEIDPI